MWVLNMTTATSPHELSLRPAGWIKTSRIKLHSDGGESSLRAKGKLHQSSVILKTDAKLFIQRAHFQTHIIQRIEIWITLKSSSLFIKDAPVSPLLKDAIKGVLEFLSLAFRELDQL